MVSKRKRVMVHAKLIKQRRVQIIDAHSAIDRTITDFIGGAVNISRLKATTGDPHGKRAGGEQDFPARGNRFELPLSAVLNPGCARAVEQDLRGSRAGDYGQVRTVRHDRIVEDMSVNDIAAVLDRSVSWTKVNLLRGRRLLDAELNQQAGANKSKAYG